MSLPSGFDYDLATVSNPSGALTDFTLIVDLSMMSSAWWAAVDTSDGTKGRAAIHNTGTELACDWIDFDAVGETGLLRVLWSGTLAASGTQQIRVYPPQDDNDSVDHDDTYGSDNAYSDIAIYYNNPLDADRISLVAGTPSGEPTEVDGHIGSAAEFESALSQRVDCANLVTSGDFTASCLVNLTSGDLGGVFGSDWRTFYESGYFGVRVGSSIAWFNVGDLVGDYHAISWTYDYSSGDVSVYVDGEYIDTVTVTAEVSNSSEFSMGREKTYGSLYGNHILQHVIISSVARSADWIAHEADQLLDNAAFWGSWTWQGGGGATPIPVIVHHLRQQGGM